MTFETLLVDTDARGVAAVTLNRAEKHNALSPQMQADLTEAAQQLAADKTVRVVVLTGQGKTFCAGGDLEWMRTQTAATRETRAEEARKLARMLGAWNSLPKPVIGAVQGNAFGGGVGLACICDVAIGVETGKLGLTETRLGLIPATIGPYVVARMGEGRARRVFMSSRLFSAAEAVDLGILARVVPPDMLAAAVEAEVAPYLHCAPGAVAMAKALALRLGANVTAEDVDYSIAELITCWEQDDAREGVGAFFDKRKARWMR
ncbi:MAG: crotonase/enoyl-CoA hydratase family protein [Pseudomonadota bacterium]